MKFREYSETKKYGIDGVIAKEGERKEFTYDREMKAPEEEQTLSYKKCQWSKEDLDKHSKKLKEKYGEEWNLKASREEKIRYFELLNEYYKMKENHYRDTYVKKVLEDMEDSEDLDENFSRR